MGASNALAAYRLYPQLPATSMRVLAFMALVARDRDAEPWWSQGHDTLAVQALGRPEPVTEADRRAVERAITPLFEAGAITTERHSSARHDRKALAEYRLWLDKPAPDEKRRVGHRSSPDEKRRVERPITRRKVARHPTKSGETPDEKRRTKEYEEDEELFKDEDQTGDRRTPRTAGGVAAGAVEPIDSYDTTTRNGTQLAAMAAADALREWEAQMAGQLCSLCLCDPSTPNGAASLARCQQAACPLAAAAAS